jgi:GntR family transcriptional regulator/MocR family aminotransferase
MILEWQLPYETHLMKYGKKTEALFHAMRESIMGGTIPPGSRLPSTRALAAQYGLSRGTVNTVYEMLQAQGYVQAIPSSGTVAVHTGGNPRPLPPDGAGETLSAWGERVRALPAVKDSPGPPSARADGGSPLREPAEGETEPGVIDFSPGRVDLRRFPVKEWNRLLYAQVRGQYRSERADVHAAEGHAPLREGIARHLRRARGLAADPDDIVIVGGSHQALVLLIQLILNPGEPAVVENPGYEGTVRAVRAAGGMIVPCPVDRNGLETDALPESARLIAVTPGRQFPTGAVMPLERRLRLLEYAERHRSFVIEDDYDSEFRFRGQPIEPLKTLDRSGRVVFVGTFSRTMMHDLRLGYAVLPPGLKEAFRKAKQLYEPHPTAILEQRALAAFLNGGGYERHLRRMRRRNMRLSERLECLLRERAGRALSVHPNDAGLYVYAEWRGSGAAFDRFLAACARRRLVVRDLRQTYVGQAKPAVALGFAHLEEDEMEEGVARLAAAAEEVLAEGV